MNLNQLNIVDVEEKYIPNWVQQMNKNIVSSDTYVDKLNANIKHLIQQHQDTLLKQIGNTPLVRLDAVSPNSQIALYAKLEGNNPSGSLKDRIVLFSIAGLMAEGELGQGNKRTLVEASSGNTGISLALFGAVLGEKVLITMPKDVSVERRRLIEAYGAELTLTPGEKGTDGAIERARKLNEKEDYIWLAQHYSEANPLAHYRTTGKELLEGLDRIDGFVAPSGTTGTLMGVGKRLREENPSTQIVSVWPEKDIMGLRRPVGEKKPGIYREGWIDEVVEVKDEDARRASRRLAKEEGIFVGPSSGASLLGALKLAKTIKKSEESKTIVALFPDGGGKYLSTDTFKTSGSWGERS